MGAGLYIHVPYCRSKCAYCDFYSSPRCDTLPSYADAVLAEASLRRDEVDGPFTTLYLGGGTPSLLPDTQLERLVEGLRSTLPCRFKEATIEANPEDISPERLNAWRDMGIDRISIGVQSFDDRMLCAIGRRHDARSSHQALDCLTVAGINYSADLIYGLPGQTPADWDRELRTLLSYRPQHLSAYLLSYEEGTTLYRRLCRGEVEEANESLAEELYTTLCALTTEAGYEHYEISNFALPGRRSRHNSAYWDMTPYLGLGPSAHSFDGSLRRFNPPSAARYVESLLTHGATCFETDPEDDLSRTNDLLLTTLRTAQGFAPSFLLSAENNYSLTESQRRRLASELRSLLAEGLLEPAGNTPYTANVPDPDNLSHRVDVSDRDNLSGMNNFSNPALRLRIPENRWLLSDAVIRRLFLIS